MLATWVTFKSGHNKNSRDTQKSNGYSFIISQLFKKSYPLMLPKNTSDFELSKAVSDLSKWICCKEWHKQVNKTCQCNIDSIKNKITPFYTLRLKFATGTFSLQFTTKTLRHTAFETLQTLFFTYIEIYLTFCSIWVQ